MKRGLDVTRVSSKGQIVVPLHIREKLEMSEGDMWGVYEYKGLLVLKKLRHPLTSSDGVALEHINRTHVGDTSVHRNQVSSPPSYIH